MNKLYIIVFVSQSATFAEWPKFSFLFFFSCFGFVQCSRWSYRREKGKKKPTRDEKETRKKKRERDKKETRKKRRGKRDEQETRKKERRKHGLGHGLRRRITRRYATLMVFVELFPFEDKSRTVVVLPHLGKTAPRKGYEMNLGVGAWHDGCQSSWMLPLPKQSRP